MNINLGNGSRGTAADKFLSFFLADPDLIVVNWKQIHT